MNVGKSKVKLDVWKFGRMHMRLNGEPLEEVDYFKYVADGGCERDVVYIMKEGCRSWGALKVC